MSTPQGISQTWRDLWQYLTPEEQAGLLDALGPVPLWEPHPENIPQQMAYDCTADIMGFGGAAGGGKTDLAIGKALNKHKKVVFFRDDAKQLIGSGGVVDRISQLVNGDRKGYNGQDRVWRNLGPRNVQIEFASLANPGDENKHQGRPKDLLVLEEATNLPEAPCRFLMGWVRTSDPNQPCQTLLTFNPPTSAEGRWVIGFFAPWLDPDYPGERAKPGELRYFATLPDPANPARAKDIEVPNGEPFVMVGDDRVYDFNRADYTGARQTLIIHPKSRTFFPSRITDNPYLTGTGYMTTLQALPEPLRSQMLYGDFTAGMKDDPWQVIPTKWIDIAMARWKKLDVVPEMEAMGIDVARGGADSTVIARRHTGWWFDEPLTYPGKETPNGPSVAGLVISASRDGAPQHYDVIGVGASAYDHAMVSNQPAYGINVAEAVNVKDKSGRLGFVNLRSYLLWHFRELLDPTANNGIALPPSEDLKKDLAAFKWQLKGGRIAVESREEVIKRIGRSPDFASAYMLCIIETPKMAYIEGMREASGHSYDPFDSL